MEAPPATHSTWSLTGLPSAALVFLSTYTPYTCVPEPMAVAAITAFLPDQLLVGERLDAS